MDDCDDGVTPQLKFDVEIEVSGPNNATMNKWVSDALRRLADRVEKDELEDGHHDVLDSVGKKIGEAYIAYDGQDEIL